MDDKWILYEYLIVTSELSRAYRWNVEGGNNRHKTTEREGTSMRKRKRKGMMKNDEQKCLKVVITFEAC